MQTCEKDVKGRGEVQGLAFFVTDLWQFYVPDLNKSFPSYDEMELAILREEKKIKQARKVKLNLPVVTRSGNEYTITGVHAGHGTVLTTPPLKEEGRYSRPSMYVKTPWMRQAIGELAEAQARVKRIFAVISPFKIEEKQNSSWGEKQGDGTPEGLEKIYRDLEKRGESMTFESAMADPATAERADW